MSAGIEKVHAPDAPRASGPYTHAVRANGFVFCAGQGSKDPETWVEAGLTLDESGAVTGYDIRAQGRACFANLASVLQAAGTDLEHVIEVNVYLKDMGDFAAMNEIYAEVFPDGGPVRTTIGVADLPGRNFVEIRAVAVEREAA